MRRPRLSSRPLLIAACLATVLTPAGGARPSAEETPTARVGAFYFDGWSGDLDGQGGFHWGGLIGTPYSGRRPLSGWRDHAPEAIEAQLRWARRAGLSFFVFDWFYDPHPDNGPLNMALETYWKLRDRSGVQAAIAYVNQPGFAIPRERWRTVVDNWVREHFLRPEYVRIDGRPLFVILDERHFILQWGGATGANDAIAMLRAAATRHGLPGVFVVGGRYLDWYSEQCFPLCLDTDADFSSVDYDAITEFSYPRILKPRPGPRPYADVAAALKRTWEVVAQRSPFPHIPAVMAGLDARPMILAGQIQRAEDGGWPLLDGYETWFVRTPADVGGLVRDAATWVRAHPGMRVEPEPAPPVILIQSWNEVQEGATLLPTEADGYDYMQAIAEAVGVPWAPPPKRVVRVTGNSSATITSRPQGISCPPTCSASFDEGWEVTFTAKAKPGWTVDAWLGRCTDRRERACPVVLVRDTSVAAVLTATVQRRTLTLRLAGRTARGRLIVLDGFQPCGKGEPVTIQRRKRGRWVDVASTWTADAGRYAIRLPAQTGTFRALVPRTFFGGHSCRAASSRVVATSDPPLRLRR